MARGVGRVPHIPIAGERLYLTDDHELGVTGNPDPAVCARHVARYTRAIELAEHKGGNWLDFACGSGYGTEMIAAEADLVVGMDRDPTAIRYAVRHHDKPNMVYRLATPDTVWSTVLSSPDVVICVETLEHMDAITQGYYLQATARGMAPGGTLVLACPIGNDGPSGVNPWHLYEPSKEFLIDMLRVSFGDVSLELEDYMSTSGPATQAWAVCR